MPAPVMLVQLSDPHVGAAWGDHRDPAALLAAAVEGVRALRPAPDAVLVTGDLADNAADGEYELVRELLAPLGARLHVLAGNHDDRAALRRHFALPGTGDEPVQYAVDLGPLRLVALDTTRPGEDRGQLDAPRLRWLDATLAAAPDRPTLLAVHHPPLRTGIAAMDELALPGDDRRALAGVVARHPQVRRIVGGHVHRVVAAELAGRSVLAAPSTYAQLELDLEAGGLRFGAGAGAFVVHVLAGGELISHVQPVGCTGGDHRGRA